MTFSVSLKASRLSQRREQTSRDSAFHDTQQVAINYCVLDRGPFSIVMPPDQTGRLSSEQISVTRVSQWAAAGRSRKKDQLRLSSFQLVRLDIDDAAWRLTDREVIGYRNSDCFRTFKAGFRLFHHFQRGRKLRPYLGKNLRSENGLNIEGIAFVDG